MNRVLVTTLLLTPIAAAQTDVSFNRDIRAILSDRCFECHGPDEHGRQAELRLDAPDADNGPFADRNGQRVLVAGDPDKSLMWQRISSKDPDLVMPPADSTRKPLSPEEQEVVRKWIKGGAEYEDFWAFVTVSEPELPQVITSGWNADIDRFVMHELQRRQKTPRPEADRRTLLRRLTLDLTGLPPTIDELQDFLNDKSKDAWEKQVNRLLNSSAHGEHMARYWLDLVRFADTNGIHHDHYREMTPYRDWVIRAFNQNLPYDQFITWQIAGDQFENPTLDQQIASGFNRLHLVIDRGTALPEESYTRNVVDRVTAFGTAFMGLTVGCAVCHDHKYDPISQKDFYQLFAFFNNIDTEPETPGRNTHPPFIRVPNARQRNELDQLSRAIEKKQQALQEANAAQKAAPEDEGLKATLSELQTQQKKLQEQKAALEKTFPITLVSKERTENRPAYILVRGAYDVPGEVVQRNTPAFLPPLKLRGKQPSRMDLADWLTDPGHPLASRVAVNRFWQQIFGVGLVKTSEDFGAQGEYPSHPELLDYLSRSFMESGWNIRRLVKSMVMSRTYRQAADAPRSEFQQDADNRWLARGSRFRLDAEVIRDQMLAVSGVINRRMYGRSVKPPQPPNLWKSVSMVSSSTYAFKADSGDDIRRRSVYSFWKRAMPPPQMTIFDAPTREACIARRERTNTPVQALVLMNEEQYFLAARAFAHTIIDREHTDAARVRFAWESVTSHLPDDEEQDALQQGLAVFRDLYANDMEASTQLTSDLKELTDEQRKELSAWTMIVNSLFNLDIVKTRQ